MANDQNTQGTQPATPDPWAAPGIVAAPAPVASTSTAAPTSQVSDPWAAPGIVVAPAPANRTFQSTPAAPLTEPSTGAYQPTATSAADLAQKAQAEQGAQPSHIYNPVTKRIEMHPDVAANVLQGVKDSFIGQLAKDAIVPPQNAAEHTVLLAGGGIQSLIAYRQAKRLVESTEGMLKAAGDKFPQAIRDFQRTIKEYKAGDYRNMASSAVSTATDVAGLTPAGVMLPTGQTRELSEGARPGGNLATPLTRQVLDAGTALIGGEPAAKVGGGVAEDAAETIGETAGKIPGKVGEVASKTADAIKPEWLTKRPEIAAADSPAHQSRLESPLDGPTVGKQLGGKDLSAEALKTLQGHVGETIPVGSTAKNMLMKAVEPVTKTINDTASKMNDIVQKAPKFTTSVMHDNVFGDGSLMEHN